MSKSPLSGIEDEPPAPKPHTASSVAEAHFEAELELHEQEPYSRSLHTIVVLHDSCYGHRYSRPRTSKAALSTIVERPERIHASILGVSMAYVRLGQRHEEGRYAPHPKKSPSQIPTFPFCVQKSKRRLPVSSPAVTNVHGAKWMEELKIMCDGAEAKLAMTGKELTRPQMDRDPEQGEPAKFHEGDLYLCAESLEAMEGALGAVCDGVDAVFKGSLSETGPRRAFVAIRPPGHHCSASYPSGFCWLNNVHVGISHAALNHGLTHAAIIDFDLHHGDGSQAIAWEHNARAQNLPKNAPGWKKTAIGYYSLHDINSYPCEQGDEEKVKNASLCIDNAHGQSIWNVHLQPWRSELEFWELYETKYTILLEKCRAFLKAQTKRLRSLPGAVQPKAAIFFSAGFDASEWESSGMQRHKVNVPTEFYARIARDVVRLAAEEGCSVDGRIVSVLEGGYSNRALSSGVFSHISGLAGDDPVAIRVEDGQNGLGYEMAQKVGSLNAVAEPSEQSATPVQPYDPAWWSVKELEAIEALVHPPPPPPEPKRPKENGPPGFLAATAASAGKVNTSPKLHRSVSKSSMNGSSPRSTERSVSPPPPEVPWTVAAHELSKLLIPTDRQTMSCRPEELSAEASRARRDRQSILTPPASAAPSVVGSGTTARMALRERKAVKAPSPEEVLKVSRADRRKTVAGSAVLVKAEPSPIAQPPLRQASRRLSLMSNTDLPSQAPTEASAAKAIPSHGRSASGVPPIPPMPDRPPSSQSIRPGSSISSRGPTAVPAPIAAKKTRTVKPATAEGAAKTTKTTKKAPSANGADTIKAQSKTETTTAADPLDSITNSMKKITISIPSLKARQQASQQNSPAAASRENSTETPALTLPSPLASHPIREPTPITQEPTLPTLTNTQRISPPASLPTTPQPLSPSRFKHLQDVVVKKSPPGSSPATSRPTTSRSATSSSGSSTAGASAPSATSPNTNPSGSVFVAYNPEGPTPTYLSQSEPLKWLPPNTGTPVHEKVAAPSGGKVERKDPGVKRELPNWSATGFIPFGGVKKEEKEKSIWEVPDTPVKR
jgi:histone deacetylase HOS3